MSDEPCEVCADLERVGIPGMHTVEHGPIGGHHGMPAQPCETCKGDGYKGTIWNDKDCPDCNGTGVKPVSVERNIANPHGEVVTLPADQWERIAAVVRAAKAYNDADTSGFALVHALNALTPDDIEAVKG